MDPLEVKRNGYSLADCAEIMAAHQGLRTEHGEAAFKGPFQQFLRSKGMTESKWAEVWNDWTEVTRADPALGAKFHAYMSQVQQRRMMADQPDVSGDVLGGLSLQQYAKISAQSQTGAAIEGLVAGEGLTMDQWQEGQAAWGAKMSSISPTDPIMLQYGQLYQKWAPNHQAMIESSTEAALRDNNDQGGRGGGMSMDLTVDNAAEFFAHDDIRVRARGVREMIRIWELDEEGRTPAVHGLTQSAYDAAIAILQTGIDAQGLMAVNGGEADGMDIHAWSARVNEEQTQQGAPDMVHGSLKDLAGECFMTSAQNDAAQDALRAAIARITPRAEHVKSLFPGVSDELKKVQIRQLMDDYQETLNDLEESLEDWDYSEPEEASEEAAAPRAAASAPKAPSKAGKPAGAAQPPATTADEGIMGILKGLPVIGDLLKMLGL